MLAALQRTGRDRRGRITCTCGGYEFIHRRKGGACTNNPDQVRATILLMQRGGSWPDDTQAIEELLMDLRLNVRQPTTTTACPF